jgi:hypothetical protein
MAGRQRQDFETNDTHSRIGRLGRNALLIVKNKLTLPAAKITFRYDRQINLQIA